MSIELIDFYADWCGPCQNMNPIIDEIEEELKDKVKITKINIDEKPDLAAQYNVMSIPNYIIKKDDKVIDQLIGMQTKETLISKLK